MRVVMKFGGVLLSSAESIERSLSLVTRSVLEGNQVVVVTSALGGITDRLVELSRQAASGETNESDLKGIREAHLEAAEAILDPKNVEAFSGRLNREIDILRMDLAEYGRDPVPWILDSILSTGERLSAPLFALGLSSMGIDSLSLLGGEAGIVTDSSYGNALPLMDICQERIPAILLPLLQERKTPVVAGFMGQDLGGRLTTLGRGGSDFSASVIGSCIDADEIWIWKAVGGIMTADPTVVPGARTIPHLSYAEAAEMAYFGAKVLHPRTIDPALDKEIPIRVKDASDPASCGTLITGEDNRAEGIVKAVSRIEGVGLVSVYGTRMAGVPGVAARVFEALAEAGINIVMISQGSSETNITMVVPEGEVDRCRQILVDALESDETVKSIEVDDDVSVVSVVGSGMRGTPGVAGRVFSAVASRGINVMMIAQGSSELNISFVVKRKDCPEALRAIHEEFSLSRMPG